jgi:hypothetical protein
LRDEEDPYTVSKAASILTTFLTYERDREDQERFDNAGE